MAADSDNDTESCHLTNKKARVEQIATIIGMIASMIPDLAEGNGEFYFKRVVSELAHVASHMSTCAERGVDSDGVPGPEKEFSESNCDDSDVLHSSYEAHGFPSPRL